MAAETTADFLSALDDLLDHERAALLGGDLDRMPGLLGRKTALIDALDTMDAVARPDLEGLKGKVMRNQALLDGALEGIRQVAARIASLKRMRVGFDTYDASGRRRTIEGDVVRRMEKRA